MKNQNPFDILGIPRDSLKSDVRVRWKQLAQKLHPDKGGDREEFNKMKNAYTKAFSMALTHRKCSTCSGSGKVKETQGFYSISVTCPTCKGSGNA